MSKHTPGPWRVRRSYQLHRADSIICEATCGNGARKRSERTVGGAGLCHEMEDDGAFEEMLGPNDAVIFGIGQGYDDAGTSPNDADAHLIAAAPELLDTLKDEHHSEFMGRNGCTGGPKCATCALIAKAEGR